MVCIGKKMYKLKWSTSIEPMKSKIPMFFFFAHVNISHCFPTEKKNKRTSLAKEKSSIPNMTAVGGQIGLP